MVVLRWSLNFSTSDSTNVSSRDPLPAEDPSDLTRAGHTVVAVFLGLIFVFGFLNNLVVLLIFAKFQPIRTPINLILLNISVSDMLVCIFGTPFSFAASLHGRWLIGYHGCKWYGFANSLFGIVSLVSLSILSYERYVTVLRSTKADVSDYRKAWLCIAGSWLYSLIWTLPPFLGWSSYGPEGPGTTCSVQWHQRSLNSISYVVCLFIFCLLLPLVLMVFCYSKIFFAIRGVAKINMTSAQRRENHILMMVVSMVSCYLLCWMPYGVVALIATFGQTGLITPTISIIPSLLAKSSTVLNPVIYMLMNNQFYRCLIAFVKCGSVPHSNNTCTNSHASSKAEDHPGNGIQLLPAASRNTRGALPTELSSLHQERRTLVLMVNYTP